MNNRLYTYSLLKYRHSQFLGEVLNIGVLVYFPSIKRLVFLKPEKLIRLKFAYPNVQEKTIKSYFKAFEERIARLNLEPELFSELEVGESFEKFIYREFLPEDSSALQFSEPQKALLYNEDYEVICNQIYNLYFSVFEHTLNSYNRIDEAQLLTKYKSLIKGIESEIFRKENNKLVNNRLFIDYKIEATGGETFKFDIGWQNGSLNLVKPVSFDVQRSETIQNKGLKFFGQFVLLEDYAKAKNIKFDLLIAKPKRKDLFKTYESTLKLISTPKNVELIEEEDLERYSQKTVAALNLFEN